MLTVDHVSYSYHNLKGETKALENISFHVNPGDFIAVVGPSGCGKSTLLSLLCGLLIPEKGSIQMAEGTTIGYMLQHDLLLEWKTVMENCLLGLKLQKQKTQDNVNFIISLLKEYGLYDFRNKKPSELSGGMKQRCALIRTIALNPDLLLLDESFSALDTQTRMIVSNDISNIIRIKQKTAILVTHDPEEALTLADRVFVLSKRPATITKEIAIHYDIPRTDPVAIRQTPEFQKYRKILWSNLLS